MTKPIYQHTHDFTIGKPVNLKSGEQDIAFECRTCGRKESTDIALRIIEKVVILAFVLAIWMTVITIVAGLNPVTVFLG